VSKGVGVVIVVSEAFLIFVIAAQIEIPPFFRSRMKYVAVQCRGRQLLDHQRYGSSRLQILEVISWKAVATTGANKTGVWLTVPHWLIDKFRGAAGVLGLSCAPKDVLSCSLLEFQLVMQSHFPERAFAVGGESRALWALEPDHTVVVFVHGYGGDAVATWSEFDALLPARIPCAHADIIFYGYNGVRSNVIAAASLFSDFLEDLSTSAPALINKGLPEAAHRQESFRHHRIILVGHSLGAVIIRWALLFAHERQSAWLSTTRMALFAPAHTGANVVNLVLSAAMGFSSHHTVS